MSGVEINEDQPKETRFGRDSKVGGGMEKLYGRKKGSPQVGPDWRLLAWQSCRRAN